MFGFTKRGISLPVLLIWMNQKASLFISITFSWKLKELFQKKNFEIIRKNAAMNELAQDR